MGLPFGMASGLLAWAVRGFALLAVIAVCFAGIGLSFSCFNGGKYGCYDENLWESGQEEILKEEKSTNDLVVKNALPGMGGFKGVIGYFVEIEGKTAGLAPTFFDTTTNETLTVEILKTAETVTWADIDWTDAKTPEMSLLINSQGLTWAYKKEFYKAGDTISPRIIGFVVLAVILIGYVIAEFLLIKFETKYGGGAEGQEFQSKRKTRFF